MYKVSFYTPYNRKSPVKKHLSSLNVRQEAKVTKALTYLKEFGLSKSIPNLRKLTSTPLWELRILGKDNIRIICAPQASNKIIVLHIFTKKKMKTPLKEINLAMNRYKYIIDN